MIDPTVSLAFSIQAAPQRYALLLGSGVSTGAGIPTGWQITLDLVAKLAAASNESFGGDPEAWYRGRYGEPPNYSRLLDDLAKTPDDRQALLRSYIEPGENDAEAGSKLPTAAHHAIASLVQGGFINVIITTNFDRLLERALTDAGIEPVVLSTSEQVSGALPPHQTPCTILKLHGDYLNSAIRNTEDELDHYPEPIDRLLDRIIDDYGLIICGWSGEWDTALRNAIMRAPSRRFTTYWTTVGDPSTEATELIKHRDATVVTIDGADKFFSELADKATAIAESSPPHPASIDAAVAQLKRYLSEPRYRIQLSDFVAREVDGVVARTAPDVLPSTNPQQLDLQELFGLRLQAYQSACETLTTVGIVGGAWAEPEHEQIWRSALSRLGSRRSGTGLTGLRELERMPATLLLYALGMGAVHQERLPFLASILSMPLPWFAGANERLGEATVTILAPYMTWGNQSFRGYENLQLPLNDWLHDHLRRQANFLTPDPDIYTRTFDKLEILIALNFAHFPPAEMLSAKNFVLRGAFGYRQENRERIINEIEQSIARDGELSPYVSSGIFGSSPDTCASVLEAFKQNITRGSFGWDG